jgi:phosphatidylinositol alpha-1,6-mannosyltransferase
MKVLFVTRKWSPAVGGMETYCMELCTSLKEQNIDLTVRYLAGQKNGKPPKIGSLVIFLLSSIAYLFRNRKVFDIYHFGDYVLFPLAWVHSKFNPLGKRIITVHGLDIIFGNRRGFAPSIYKYFIAWCHKRKAVITEIITNSSNTSILVEKMGLGPATSIPLGVRLRQVDFLPANKSIYILFIGRLVKRKGAAWFVQNVLPKLSNTIKLKVVGKVWDEEEAKILYQNKQVEMLGFVEDDELDVLKKEASMIIMPNIPSEGDTDVEGFGLVALEASASGSPLIASNIEGITDAVISGKTGFLVPALDEASWVNKINEILDWSDQQRRVFSEDAYSSLQIDYSWGRVAKQTKDVYEKVCSPV